MNGSPLARGQDGGILAHMVTAKLAIAALALILAFAVLLATHFWQLHEAFQDSLAAKVQITAVRVGDAMKRRDQLEATAILQALRGAPEVIAASLYTPDGTRLADYLRDHRARSPELDAQGQGWNTVQRQSLLEEGQIIGHLVVKASLEVMARRLAWFFGIGVVTVVIALGVGWSVFVGLRRKVSDTESDLRRMAWYDPVTKLPNRNLFMQRLREAVAEAREVRRGVAVLFIDLDNFKLVNDTLGHEAGDVLLVTVAERLRNLMRVGDSVCRLGGDEFVILLHPCGRGEAQSVAERALDAIGQPVLVYEQEVYVGGSIGIARFPEDGMDANALLRCADTAMYQAKDNGRNNHQFYTSDMNLKALQHFAIETSLRKALERDEMLLYYQPLVDVETRAIVGVEALLRWKSEEFGTFASGDFIAIAEQSGLINQLGHWALTAACRQMREWRDAGISNLTVAVNLSPRQFHNGDLVQQVREALLESGLEPGALELEITESVLIKHNMEAIEKLTELANLGVKLAIDDFGTGYSSLSYLKRLPIHRLKIDRSFVRESHIDPDDAAIATAIIGMAAGLGIEVTAEGVENEEQLAFLKQAGCQIVQGYYFGSPLPAEDLAKLVRQVRA
ncbi:MAG: EAL domain-containing protein [Pseudomonadota bacterium]|nr:EAL domain-containing protein [Pseudomonadota bacterium]MDP1905681.1 EAL domain-containing protein [Pseudomonadota bacterium]MDP2353553.1 EAL domain-containing protein [Pseudomonadota bacterium]